jgi:flagellar motility protein MotE (MotC chaperone)
LRWQARLLVSALVVGAGIALMPLALSGATAEKKQEAKAQAQPADTAKDTAKPSVVTVGPPAKDPKKQEKPDKPTGKPEAESKPADKPEAKAEGTPVGKKDDKPPAGQAASKGTKGGQGSAANAEPPPPTTPPIKMAGLREEMSRPPRKEDHLVGARSERERLEQLASEINKAREGLRQDTARLEALLAARDLAAPSGTVASAAAAAGEGSDAPKKTPTSLDNLAKAIRGMKPEQAAPIISRVDRKLAADVLLRMPGGDAGKVLGVCKPEVAAELAAEIASRTPRAELHR